MLIVHRIKPLILKLYHQISSISLPGHLLELQITKPHAHTNY